MSRIGLVHVGDPVQKLRCSIPADLEAAGQIAEILCPIALLVAAGERRPYGDPL